MPYLRSLGSRVRALVQRLHGCTCVFAKSGADVRGERTCCPSDGPKKVTTTRAGPKRLARRKPRKLVFAWPKVAAPRASSFGLGQLLRRPKPVALRAGTTRWPRHLQAIAGGACPPARAVWPDARHMPLRPVAHRAGPKAPPWAEGTVSVLNSVVRC